MTRPLANTIRPEDRLEIRVTLRNDTGIVLEGTIRGAIRPTPSAQFPAASFDLRRLEAGEQCEIALIELRLLDRDPGRALNQVATVSVSGRPDLSEFRFRDAGRLLTHVKPTSDARGVLSLSRIEPALARRRAVVGRARRAPRLDRAGTF